MMMLGLANLLGLGLDLHFAVLVSVLLSTFMQLLSACGERERVLMLYLIWFHWMRCCGGACVGAAG